MKNKASIIVLSMVSISMSLACGLTSRLLPEPTATPTATIDFAATQAYEMRATEQAFSLQETRMAEAELLAQATKTARAEEKATQKAEERIRATEEIEALMTQVAGSFQEDLNELVEDGILTSAEGDYYWLGEFEESWAQINYYTWERIGLETDDFIIRAHLAWESASTSANYFSSGCGFVYGDKDESNHWVTFLGLDGIAHTIRSRTEGMWELEQGYYGRVDVPKGEADMMVVVADQFFTVYVNGKKLVRIYDPSYFGGHVGLTLVSGTNAGFGTRCHMTDIELWDLR